MDDPKINDVFQWLVKAEHDIGSARRLISGDIPYFDTAVYHCQIHDFYIKPPYLLSAPAPSPSNERPLCVPGAHCGTYL